MEERGLLNPIRAERRNRPDGDGEGGGVRSFTKVESLSATGINTQQIYDGERVDNDEIEPYKILAIRLGMPAVKVAALVDKGGKDEWKKVIE